MPSKYTKEVIDLLQRWMKIYRERRMIFSDLENPYD